MKLRNVERRRQRRKINWTVKRAQKTCNFFGNVAAKRVEQRCCAFHDLRKKKKPCNR